MAALPKSDQPGAKAAIREITGAEDKAHAAAAAKLFAAQYGPKCGAVQKDVGCNSYLQRLSEPVVDMGQNMNMSPSFL